MLVDDIDGSRADETVSFMLDGVAYEIDLSAANAARLREALADYVARARRLSRTRRGVTATNGAVPSQRTGRGGAGATRRSRQSVPREAEASAPPEPTPAQEAPAAPAAPEPVAAAPAPSTPVPPPAVPLPQFSAAAEGPRAPEFTLPWRRSNNGRR